MLTTTSESQQVTIWQRYKSSCILNHNKAQPQMIQKLAYDRENAALDDLASQLPGGTYTQLHA